MSNYTNRLKSYNSYSGCDMVATLQISSYSGLKNNVYTLGSLQTISISTHQDKRPVRSLGNINAKEYTMGQRTIAGSLVFAVFDKHFADEMFKDSLESINSNEDKAISTIILPDELPPFDITISYANEYGHTSRMALYGVRLVNEGQVMSINDIYTENTYQFVATALEPLNKDENIGQAQKSYLKNKITTPTRSVLTSTEDINTIVESYNNGGDLYSKDVVQLSVNVENPNTITGTGIAKFILEPSQTIGEIKIHGQSGELYLINLEEFPNSKTYSMNLKTGSYYAYYESTNKTSNTVTFKIIYENKNSNDNSSGPIIEYITDKNACILCNNINHDTAICSIKEGNTREATVVETVSIKSKKAIFKSLIPNTIYEFQTCSSKDPSLFSSKTQSKTLKYDTEMIDEFKKYISLNEEILISDVSEITTLIDKNTSSVKNIYNIVDFALSIDTSNDENDKSVKNEIVFFAIKFQNHINYDLNKYATVKQPSKNLSNPYYNTINIPNDIDYCNIFKTEKGKSIFREKVSNMQSYEYIDKSNVRYYAYGIDGQSRGPKYDFVCFDAQGKDDLINYSSCNELSLLSTDSIQTRYPGISSVNSTRLAAEHFKSSNITYLSKPKVTVNQDLSLDIHLNYSDCIARNEELVLCFCDANEVLDVTPKKKVKIGFTNNVNLQSFYTGIKFNKSYAIWIENTNGFIISKIETFNTYIDNQDIIIEDENIKTNQLIKEIKSISSRLNQKIEIRQELNEILESEKYNLDSHESLIYDNIISNIVLNNSVITNDFYLIAKLLEVKTDKDVFLTDNFNVKAKYSRKEKTIKFLCDKNIKISNTYIDISTGELNKSIETPKDNTIKLNHLNGYNILFCIADGMYANSGFIIIDNSNKNYYTYSLSTEVI